MENASKALLIAGAILLVIAIIAIGMGLLGTAEQQIAGVTDNMGYAAQAYNQNLTPFIDTELTSLTYNNLKTAAMKAGMTFTPGANGNSFATLSNNGRNTVSARIDDYITADEINGTNIDPITNRVLTKDDIGKIQGITIMVNNADVNTTFDLVIVP